MYSDKKIAKMIKAKIGKEEITHHAVTKHIRLQNILKVVAGK